MEIRKKITFALTENEKKAFETVTTILRDLSRELWYSEGDKTLLLGNDADYTTITADEIDSIAMWLDWFPDCEDIYTEKEEKRD